MVVTRSGRDTAATCDICGKVEPIHNQCCSVKVCFSCDCILAGQCSVCQRDELNMELHCECCGRLGNSMTIRFCPYCEGLFCENCLSINDSPVIVCTSILCEQRFWLGY